LSQDSFTEVTHQSWFSRLAGAIKSVLAGIFLFIISFPLLWWNEGRAVHTAQGIQDFGAVAVAIQPDKVDPQNDKKPVCLTGEATTKETLADPDFKVSSSAIKLRRNVEMYQWKQTADSTSTKKLGGSQETKTTYKFDKTWSDKLIKSDEFKGEKDAKDAHKNPEAMRLASLSEQAKEVKLGAFRLPSSLVDKWVGLNNLSFTKEQLAGLPKEMADQAVLKDDVIYLSGGTTAAKVNPAMPEIGDLRISFQELRPGVVSVAARQLGDTFEAWQSPGNGTSVFELEPGTVSKENMVKGMEAKNSKLTWILRLVGFVLMALGLAMVFSPIAVVADVIPLIGDLLRMGTGLFAGVIAAALSLLTISIAWIAYRPLLGIPLAAVSLGLIVMLFMLGKSRKAAKQSPVPVAAR
jgi:hypothetical protein